MKGIYALLLAAAVALTAAGCGSEVAKETAQEPSKTASRPESPKPDKAKETAKATESKPAAEKPTKVGEVVTTKSGLKYKEKKIGSGPAVVSGDTVTVHYKGWLDNGKVFDTSRKEGRDPFRFMVGAGYVIPGWEEGVAGMKAGGIRELTVPAKLGYGDQPMGDIPPNSTLHFEIELLEVDK